MHPVCRMRIDVDQAPPEHLAGSPALRRSSRNRACDRRWVMTEMMKWRLARGSISVQAQLCIDVA
jgi:hypothetical protein